MILGGKLKHRPPNREALNKSIGQCDSIEQYEKLYIAQCLFPVEKRFERSHFCPKNEGQSKRRAS